MKNNVQKIAVSIEINAPAAVVFNAVTNWEIQEKWVFLTKVWGTGDNSQQLGGKIEAFTGVGKVGFLDTMTITKWDENRVCEVTHTGNVVKGKGLFEVTVKDSVTYFTWTEYVHLPFGAIGRVGWLVVKPFVRLGLNTSLKRLKKYIENSAT